MCRLLEGLRSGALVRDLRWISVEEDPKGLTIPLAARLEREGEWESGRVEVSGGPGAARLQPDSDGGSPHTAGAAVRGCKQMAGPGGRGKGPTSRTRNPRNPRSVVVSGFCPSHSIEVRAGDPLGPLSHGELWAFAGRLAAAARAGTGARVAIFLERGVAMAGLPCTRKH